MSRCFPFLSVDICVLKALFCAEGWKIHRNRALTVGCGWSPHQAIQRTKRVSLCTLLNFVCVQYVYVRCFVMCAEICALLLYSIFILQGSFIGLVFESFYCSYCVSLLISVFTGAVHLKEWFQEMCLFAFLRSQPLNSFSNECQGLEGRYSN